MNTTVTEPPEEYLSQGDDMPPPSDHDHGTADGFRSMPHNLEAEKALLGAILVNNRAHEQVSEFLRPEHFAVEQHAKVFLAAEKLIDHGQVADPVTLKRFSRTKTP